MHYHAEVVIPAEGEVEAHVHRMMAPHGQGAECQLWDGYQIGGRFTGQHSSYDPHEDPRNMQVCELCAGTGRRTDDIGQRARVSDPAHTCNGCQGKGAHLRWPTQRAPFDGDIVPISAVSEGLMCHALFMPDGAVLLQERWDGGRWVRGEFDGDVAKALGEPGITEGRVVTVDYA